jgi:2-polyprenyl-3-methyl-5-hydroxy-6-metoxy-1,4-benzoquinol methylase
MYFRLPSPTIYDRVEFILQHCKGRRVLHIGACQADDDSTLAELERAVKQGSWLHKRISDEADACLGVDYNAAAVSYLSAKHGINNIRCLDIERPSPELVAFQPDVVIVGELIEHLKNPGHAMENIRSVITERTIVVITTPNATSIWNVIGALRGKEAQNKDHSLIFSPRTITRFLDKCDFDTQSVHWYHECTKSMGIRNYFPRARYSAKHFFALLFLNVVLRLVPGYAMGLLVVAKMRPRNMQLPPSAERP